MSEPAGSLLPFTGLAGDFPSPSQPTEVVSGYKQLCLGLFWVLDQWGGAGAVI